MNRTSALAILLAAMVACVGIVLALALRAPGSAAVAARLNVAAPADTDSATGAAPAQTAEARQTYAIATLQPLSAATAAPQTTQAANADASAGDLTKPLTVAAGESFGTDTELSESASKYDNSALSAQTGLSADVLSKLYTPFYVLDIGINEMYYPLTSPGGSAGSNKIYGGQVGVQVVSIDGDYAHIKAYRYPGGRAIEGYVPVKKLKQVAPDDRYSIVIDKRQQRLFLFEYGKLKADMYCSTGKTTTETPAGEFLKSGTKRTIYSDADPDVAYYGVHLNGRVFIHSVSQVGGDYSKSIAMLGRKASHGCIRVPLDWAKWFYQNLPDGTKVIITEYRGDTPPLGEGGREDEAEDDG